MSTSLSTRALFASLAAIGLSGLAGCASTSNTAPAASAGMIALPVEGMACPNCAKEIESELAQVPGVRKATVNFDKKVANVTLDPDRPATREQLNAAVEHWRVEHFGLEEDENCLDPKRREEIKKGQQ